MKYIFTFICALSLLPSTAHAQQTFVVNSLGDQHDGFPGNGVCLTVQGVCTLRAAIDEANALPNGATPDVIVFDDIPMTNGIAIIEVTWGQFPDITDAVIIDAETAPGEVVLDGSYSASAGFSLAVGSRGSTIRGMTIGHFLGNGIEIFANNIVVENNYIGISQSGSISGTSGSGITILGNNNRIGGINKGNVIGNTSHGIRLGWGTGNVIRGNYIGTTPDLQNAATTIGIELIGGEATVGGPTRAYGNIIGFSEVGIRDLNFDSGYTVRNNYIGTNEDGDNLGNEIGINVWGIENLIGGSQHHGNVIGFNDTGIYISGTGNTIKGNYIGVNEAGQDIGNGRGIYITNYNTNADAASNNLIGYAFGATIDSDTEKANTIAYNEEAGIHFYHDPAQQGWPLSNTIRGNHIYENGLQGIALSGALGPTINDYFDADAGPNNQVNYPDVAHLEYTPGLNVIRIEYSISSAPTIVAYPFTVDVYIADDRVSGEGKTYIGSDTYWNPYVVQTLEFDANSFTWAPTDVLVLTATDAQGNTSEFSPATDVIRGPGNTVARAPEPSRLDVASPEAFDISAPYPNPFSGRATFTVALEEGGPVHIHLYDLLGREVRSVFKGHLPASGPFSFDIDGSDLPDGTYWIRAEAQHKQATRSIILRR